MIRPCLILTGFVLAACQQVVAPASTADLSQEVVVRRDDTPPARPEGACWSAETTPAIIETVTEQVLVTPKTGDDAGAVGTSAIFRTAVHQKIVRERRDVWLRTPCAGDLTGDPVASLQRALKARGYFTGAVTGTMDDATRRAIRAYQDPLGLDSETLSLEAARTLGLVAADLGRG